MPFPVNLKEIENAIANSNISEKEYDSNEYYLIKTCFTLICGLQDFIDHVEKHKDFTVDSKKDWMKFLQIYYDNYHNTSNIFKSYLENLTITSSNLKEVKKIISWVVNFMKSGLKEIDNETLYFSPIIFAGKFYTSVHYYNYIINAACDKRINLTQDKTKGNLSLVIDERKWIEETYETLKQEKNDAIPEELENKLFALWDRTNAFVAELENDFLHCF